MPKIILFNGPPRSGKDTATRLAIGTLGKRAAHYRFAGPLKDSIHGLFGFGVCNQERFDKIKDQPSPLFFGMSPREAYIWLSEDVVKPKFGKDFFAKVATHTLSDKKYDQNIIVISDCGFAEEVEAMIAAFGVQNVAIVYLKRSGTGFKGDSRNYVTNVECQQYTIENNGTLNELHDEINRVLKDFANAK